MIQFDSPHVSVFWSPSHEAVLLRWKGYCQGLPYRHALDEGLGLAERRVAKRWISDLSLFGLVSAEDQQWADDDWLPRALQSRLTHMGLVCPHTSLGRMSVERVVERAGTSPNLEIGYFMGLAAAEDWLDATRHVSHRAA